MLMNFSPFACYGLTNLPRHCVSQSPRSTRRPKYAHVWYTSITATCMQFYRVRYRWWLIQAETRSHGMSEVLLDRICRVPYMSSISCSRQFVSYRSTVQYERRFHTQADFYSRVMNVQNETTCFDLFTVCHLQVLLTRTHKRYIYFRHTVRERLKLQICTELVLV